MCSRTCLAIFGAKVHALSYMVSPLCKSVSAWAIDLFRPNLGFGRLVLLVLSAPEDTSTGTTRLAI
jgi:hypothetical protein